MVPILGSLIIVLIRDPKMGTIFRTGTKNNPIVNPKMASGAKMRDNFWSQKCSLLLVVTDLEDGCPEE